MDRLRRDRGMDLAAEVPQVRSSLRQLVIDATNPSPTDRIPDVATFLERLDAVREDVLGISTETDPLEAGPGAELAGGRFVTSAVSARVRRRSASWSRTGRWAGPSGCSKSPRTPRPVSGCAPRPRCWPASRTIPASSRYLDDAWEVGGRTTLLLNFAGRTTLAEDLKTAAAVDRRAATLGHRPADRGGGAGTCGR